MLHAYVKSAMRGAARRAEDLLMEVVRRCTAGGGSDDLESGNTCEIFLALLAFRFASRRGRTQTNEAHLKTLSVS